MSHVAGPVDREARHEAVHVESGVYVDGLARVRRDVPPVTCDLVPARRGRRGRCAGTVCVDQSDSTPPMFVYWFCIIARYVSVSRLLPPCAGTLHGRVGPVEPVRGAVGPVNVELATLAQSTWNFQTRIAFVTARSTAK